MKQHSFKLNILTVLIVLALITAGCGARTIEDDEGNIYVGEVKGGNPHGQGVLTLASGNIYEGEFEDGMKHGRGTYAFANGDECEGEYKDDLRHGQGTYTFASGEVWSGRWENGEYVGP